MFLQKSSAIAADEDLTPNGEANPDEEDLHLETTYIPALLNTISYALRSAGASRFASAWLEIKERSQTAYAESADDICELPAVIGPCKLRVGRQAIFLSK